MILILTEPIDPHADHVIQMLESRGAECLRFNPADFPVRASLALGYTPHGPMRSCLRVGDKALDLSHAGLRPALLHAVGARVGVVLVEHSSNPIEVALIDAVQVVEVNRGRIYNNHDRLPYR